MSGSKPKVALAVFNPFTNDSRVLKEAISLHKAGFDVTVVAHGAEKLLSDEVYQNGFRIKRFSLLDRKKTRSFFGKLYAYIGFLVQGINYAKTMDICHCNDLITLPAGVIIKKFFNKQTKIVYDAHEYEINDTPNESKYRIKAKYFMERFLIPYADRVITVSNAIADEYVKLYGIEKPALVLNTPAYRSAAVKRDLLREKLGIRAYQTIFLYQGGLSRGRGIETLLEVFEGCKEKKKIIVFMGYGPLESLIREKADTCQCIYFHEAVSPEILLDYTSSADYGISTIEDSCLSYRYSLPNKMFEYLMAEIPVVISDLPEMKKVVEQYGVGVVAKTNSTEGLKNAIVRAVSLDLKELQANIKQAKRVYNWQGQEKILLEIYRAL